jgi:hypothetical protein
VRAGAIGGTRPIAPRWRDGPADEAWTKRYMSNGFSERREMLLLNLILASEVSA